MVKMDKVRSYKKTDTAVIFKYKTDGKKYTVTVPFYIDGIENPKAQEYLDLYEKESKKGDLSYYKLSKFCGGIVLAAGVFVAAVAANRNYKICTDPNYVVEHRADAGTVAYGGIMGGAYAAGGLSEIVIAKEKIKQLKKEQKSRK